LVLGAPNSSNSNRLKELSEQRGVRAYLIESYRDIQPSWLEGVETVGITAGASAPEVLVGEVIDYLKSRGADAVEELTVVEENVQFQLPKELVQVRNR
jgi:4-hydroxy-3-methylbut-2-enyl diphosphate reductase